MLPSPPPAPLSPPLTVLPPPSPKPQNMPADLEPAGLGRGDKQRDGSMPWRSAEEEERSRSPIIVRLRIIKRGASVKMEGQGEPAPARPTGVLSYGRAEVVDGTRLGMWSTEWCTCPIQSSPFHQGLDGTTTHQPLLIWMLSCPAGVPQGKKRKAASPPVLSQGQAKSSRFRGKHSPTLWQEEGVHHKCGYRSEHRNPPLLIVFRLFRPCSMLRCQPPHRYCQAQKAVVLLHPLPGQELQPGQLLHRGRR